MYKSYPQYRINTQMIYRFALAQVGVQVNVLLNNCKQNIASLSLLAGMTVGIHHRNNPWAAVYTEQRCVSRFSNQRSFVMCATPNIKNNNMWIRPGNALPMVHAARKHAYQTLECSTSGWILKTIRPGRESKIGEWHTIDYAFLRLWYNFEVRKFSRFVRFTFRVK